ncbi:uncharacterized protein LOC129905330 isoform X2 [Episyrphus balteatus]|uniref:uncharacterized protein LOC129905330 isoform X2 n=1 Tax=Episyrphus balteatus TaxID=286459 RepID=UPI002484F1A2|nr:uncharacterized protein LOC129905330 isoform X2 [Episyrphus balteatus]XP_055836763.1 uncharacterized protein LOC129905330 isoform X2 [Episyrphus balteatus]
MSKKMWNRIFKTKSANKPPGISKILSIQTTPSYSSTVENRLSYYEEFHNSCQQQQLPVKEKTSYSPKTTSQSSSNKSQSKFSKVVNTFTLKRNSKENQNSNKLNTSSIAGESNEQNGNNFSTEETAASAPIMDKIGTPTTITILKPPDGTIEPNEEPISLELIPCPTCNRTFIRQTLEKHIGICEKMAIKKRKIFDSSRQRREGTELASYPLPKNYGLPAVKQERGISPKPIQAAPLVLSPKKRPEESNTMSTSNKCITSIGSKKLASPSKTPTSLFGNSSANITVAGRERSRTVGVTKRILQPQAEPCPYCERCFGVKAYDRHVEWCKEKALIASIKQQNTNSQTAAKERLEARIKYRAPCLKTKRSLNRDKYSYQTDENFELHSSMDENNQKPLMTSSMTSSIMSDSVVSDNYDPFISAKRQLEELCSPSSSTDGNIFPSNSVALTKTPKLPLCSTSNKMTTSFTSRGSLTNPRTAVTTPKSNFHRTSSLRAPRRSPLPMSSRPIFLSSSQKQRPTIQRGLSDEGPISSNFLKPEEYDEMPVRAVCVNDFAISNTPRVIRRDSSAASNRKTQGLKLPNAGQRSKNDSPTLSQSNLLKTDSLAVFLKYENEARESNSSVVNTKELKDKSNALSKQNSSKSVISTDDQPLVNPKSDISQTTDNSVMSNAKRKSLRLEPIVRPVADSQNLAYSVRQFPPTVDSENTSWSAIKLNSIFDRTTDSDYIDPKLINVCDNLPMELGNDLASNSSSSPPYTVSDLHNCDAKQIGRYENTCQLLYSDSSPKKLPIQKDLLAEMPSNTTSITKSCTNSNRSSGCDNRNLLKRKIRLGRNQFLYDASPEALDNDADDEGTNRSSCDQDRRKPLEQISFYPTVRHDTDTTPNIPPFSPSTFNEFDFEEFLSAFDNDDEQFPSLFKDCREFLMNRSTLNKRSNVDSLSSCRSPKEILVNTTQKYEQDMQLNLDSDENKNRGEIFISIETDQNENDPHPKNDPLVAANPRAEVEEVKINDNRFQKIEDNETEGENSGRVEDDESDNQLRMRRINLLNDFPNVRLNNAKNLIQQMHEDFQNLHTATTVGVGENLNFQSLKQITESSSHPVDSDEINNIEGYPELRGGNGGESSGAVQSKQSADSAYGSLSRQSPSTDINTNHRSNLSKRNKPTSAPPDSPKTGQHVSQCSTLTSQKYSNSSKNVVQKYRSRNLSLGSSSSSSDNSLPPISTKNLSSALKEHQTHIQGCKRAFLRNPLSSSPAETKNNSTKSPGSISDSSCSNNLSSLLTLGSSNVKVSKFCHECGSKFLLDQAKFCMDCGVRRIVLK